MKIHFNNAIIRIAITCVLITVLSTLFYSCKALVWGNENKEELKNYTFQVPAQGKTYTFYCLNMDNPNFAFVENDKEINGEWYRATIEGNKLTVTIDPSLSREKRVFEFSAHILHSMA